MGPHWIFPIRTFFAKCVELSQNGGDQNLVIALMANDFLSQRMEWAFQVLRQPLTSAVSLFRAAIVPAGGGRQSTGHQRGTGRPRVKSVPWKKWMVSNSQGFSKMGLSPNFPSHGPGLSAKRDDWGSPMT